MYVHRQDRLYLSIYVDDFKMAGRKSSLTPMWGKIKTVLDIDPPVPLSGSTYLGCRQDDIVVSNIIKESLDAQRILHAVCCTKGNQPSQGGVIEDPALAKAVASMRGVDPPDYALASKKRRCAKPHPEEAVGMGRPIHSYSKKQVRAWEYNMTGHAASCVDKYLELGNLESSSLKYVAHPCIDDHMLNDDDLNTKGTLSPVAARIVLQILYLSRHNRPDPLWTVNALSRNVTKWRKGDDKRLHRLISYIHYHPTCIQFCYVGDHLRDCYLALFVMQALRGISQIPNLPEDTFCIS